MSIKYRIYSNHGSGGLVDYSTPLATVDKPTYQTGPVAYPSDSTFVVHAYDELTGQEEANTDASIRLILDGQGNDVTDQPNPVQGMMVNRTQGAGARISWSYVGKSGTTAPTNFMVRLSNGSTEIATAKLAYHLDRLGYSVNFPGPFNMSTYQALVAATNRYGINSAPVIVTAQLGQTTDPFVINTLTIE